MARNFYVYFHINPIKGEVFYVGKGFGNRAWEKTMRNRYWNNTIKKYGYFIHIVEDNLTEEEAYDLEKFYIEKIGRKNIGTGHLVNMTEGGVSKLPEKTKKSKKEPKKKKEDK